MTVLDIVKDGAASLPAAVEPRGLRILLVQTQAENAGAQEISRLLSQGLETRGHTVHQLFLFRRTDAFDGSPNAVFCADRRPTGPRSIATLLARLFGHVRRLRPDVVLCFQHYGNLIGAPVARLAGARVVIANQTSATLTTPALARQLDRLCGALGLFTRTVVNSSDAELEYKGYPRSYRSRLIRIDHGFQDKGSALGRAAARAAFGLPGAGVLLGCVARLHPLKHLDAAIRLLPLDRDWRLALAGQGASRADLVDLARRLGCADRVHFLGELPSAQVGDFLAALDVFVFPSLAETFGLAVVEAAQAGVPVVANRLDVLEEVLAVDGGPCALFVDVDDTDAFAGAVRRLLDDPLLADALAARGRRLKQRYSLDAMVDAYEALIEGLAAPPRSPSEAARAR
jgi:glycosyltransferase involved in cell wall biosynthesis